MARRIRRQKKTLLNASKILAYEVSMYVNLTSILSRKIAGDTVLKNAILEAYVAHLRIMIDFFYPTQGCKEDDVIASDFFPTIKDWDRIRPPLAPTLRIARKRSHKLLAHLTYSRLGISGYQKEWRISRLWSEVGKLLALFHQCVSNDKLHPTWNNLMTRILNKGQFK